VLVGWPASQVLGVGSPSSKKSHLCVGCGAGWNIGLFVDVGTLLGPEETPFAGCFLGSGPGLSNALRCWGGGGRGGFGCGCVLSVA